MLSHHDLGAGFNIHYSSLTNGVIQTSPPSGLRPTLVMFIYTEDSPLDDARLWLRLVFGLYLLR